MALAVLIASCERGAPAADGSEASRPAAAETDTPAVIDADWVATKFQAPPPPEEKNWAREIEKDPIAALKQMDPGALQPKRAAPPRPSPTSTSAPRERTAKYDPEASLRGWPPSVGQLYPSFVLEDQDGRATAIGDFRGKVVLIEVVGLTCKACHAFAGGNDPGRPRFRGITPQPGLPSIERYAVGYANVSLSRPDVVFVQLVLYGMDGQTAPKKEDVRDWARHFDLRTSENAYVLVGDARFISPETRRLIPGFHLVDQNGILRSMSSNDPRHDPLHSSLLPKLAELVKGR